MRVSEKTSILLVSSHPEDFQRIREILDRKEWAISSCATVAEAGRCLGASSHSIVVCEPQLSDGTWRDLLRAANAVPHAPRVLVMSRLADEHLWAEVLDCGGYDVLSKPLDRAEVTRVVGTAWRHWFDSVRASILVAMSPAAQTA